MATDIELLSRKAARQAALAEAGLAALPPESELAGKIEWIRLHPFFSSAEIRRMCAETVSCGYKTLCLPFPWTAEAAFLLASSAAGISTPVGFPLGTTPREVKKLETSTALSAGNIGINVVLPLHLLKSGDKSALRLEMEEIRESAQGAVLSFFLETSLMDEKDIITAVRAAEMARADRVIGGTGWFGFPTIRDIALLRCAAPDWMEVGASVESVPKGGKLLPFLAAAGAQSILAENPAVLFNTLLPAKE